MNPEVFSKFLARQGHRIIKTESCYWYNAQPGFYFYFPYHRLITPSRDELKRILLGERSIGVRYFTPPTGVGKSSYMVVCSDKNYDITSVDANYARHQTRRQTQRGLENFEIKQLTFKELATLGNPLNFDTLVRQGRSPQVWSEQKWRLYCEAADGLDGFEAWGAFSGQTLASFMMAFQMEDHFTILHQSSATEFLRSYPNNALVFSVTKLKLAQPNVNTVSYGPQSLDAPESLDTFKFRMGFEQRPMKQTIVFNPLIKPFINGAFHKSIQYIANAKPQSDTFRKVEGLVRFYREAS
jgi:hypothetical protein